MTFKNYFDKVRNIKALANKSAQEIGAKVESAGALKESIEKKERFVPRVNFLKPANFARFGSAQEYYNQGLRRITNTYPYDGSLQEKLEWENNSTYIDLYLFDERYPRTNGYITTAVSGWSTLQGAQVSGYGTPSVSEYIYFKGGPNTNPKGMSPYRTKFTGSNYYEPAKNRESNLKCDVSDKGASIEFWMKKGEFLPALTEKEVIFDLWNNNSHENDADDNYGRLRLELTGTNAVSLGADPFLLTLRSGSYGFTTASLGSSLVTTSSVADNKWHHYAVALKNTAVGKSIKFDGIDDGIKIGTAALWDGLIGNDDGDALAFSISAWVYTGDMSSYAKVWDFGNYDRSLYITTGELRFQIRGTTTGRVKTSTNTPAANSWAHVVCTFEGGDPLGASGGGMKIYLNGVDDTNVESSYDLDGPDRITGAGGMIGLESDGAGGAWDGYINNVSIWNTELSSADVSEIYNGGVPNNLRSHSSTGNLLSWYPMGSGPKDTLETTQPDGVDDTTPTSRNRIQDVIGLYGVRDGFCSNGNMQPSAITSYAPINSAVTMKFYVDGELNNEKQIGTGIVTLSGSIGGLDSEVGSTAYIGALINSPSGSLTVPAGAGKLSASLDEFRYWKTQRTSEQIGLHWFTDVNGGVNSDPTPFIDTLEGVNTNLGVYYKFNEGITDVTSTDSIILDYSGRLSNGAWTGYTAGARSTGSAIVISNAAIKEFKDPIIYSYHPSVVALSSSLYFTGSNHDFNNNSSLYNSIPAWITEEDVERGAHVRNLTQILGSYFDTLQLQIESLTDIKNVEYPSGSQKPLPFAKHLVESTGLIAPELFVDADVYEKLASRSETKLYEKDLDDVKNTIYQNIYNNINHIYKSKGTQKAFRNLIRCFGIDERLVNVNMYADNVEIPLESSRKTMSVGKKYVNFNTPDNKNGVVFSWPDPNNSNSTGSIKGNAAMVNGYAQTYEAEIIFPEKPNEDDDYYFDTNVISSSLFGVHGALHSASTRLPTEDRVNFQVYAVRDELTSPNARFILTSSNGGLIGDMITDLYEEVYNTTRWNFAVKIKPRNYPFENYVTDASTSDYIIEFQGVESSAGEIVNEFILTKSLSSINDGFVTGSKRVFAGAHKTNITGATIHPSDVKVSSIRYWLDYLEPQAIRAHALDAENYGTEEPHFYAYPFDFGASYGEISRMDTLALNWDFNQNTGSNTSGQFTVADLASGSAQEAAARWGWIGDVLNSQITALGSGFLESSTTAIDKNYIVSAKLQNPEVLSPDDMVRVLNQQDIEIFTKESRPINYFFAFEKSMSNAVSTEMLNYFSSMKDFNTLIGAPFNRYRTEYKDMKFLRMKFFNKVANNTLDFDRFYEYYKWFDSSLSMMLAQLVPASADFAENVRTVIEPHVLERSKYQHKFPFLDTDKAGLEVALQSNADYGEAVGSPTDDPQGVGFYSAQAPSKRQRGLSTRSLVKNWNLVHHPPGGSETEKTLWWRNEAERDIGALSSSRNNNIDRQQVLNSIRKANEREKLRPYKFSGGGRFTLGGVGFGPSKRHNLIYDLTYPAGPVVPKSNIPENVVVGFSEDVEGLIDTTDVYFPSYKQRLGFVLDAGLNKGDRDRKYDAGTAAPFSLYNSTLGRSGYNFTIYDNFKTGVEITNLHHDMASAQSDIPMQGPFAEKFVGGRQYRHTPVNKYDSTAAKKSATNYLDNRDTRGEGFKLMIGRCGTPTAGALGIVGPQYPDPSIPATSATSSTTPGIDKGPYLTKSVRIGGAGFLDTSGYVINSASYGDATVDNFTMAVWVSASSQTLSNAPSYYSKRYLWSLGRDGQARRTLALIGAGDPNANKLLFTSTYSGTDLTWYLDTTITASQYTGALNLGGGPGWYHIVVADDSSNNWPRVYVNGVSASLLTPHATASQKSTGTPTAVQTWGGFGNLTDNSSGWPYGNNTLYSGSFGEAALWARQLSVAEITSLGTTGGDTETAKTTVRHRSVDQNIEITTSRLTSSVKGVINLTSSTTTVNDVVGWWKFGDGTGDTLASIVDYGSENQALVISEQAPYNRTKMISLSASSKALVEGGDETSKEVETRTIPVPYGNLFSRPKANLFRSEVAKRPLNFKNILMTTASLDVRLSGTIMHSNIGNYQKNYQVIQTAARSLNDPFFNDQSFNFALYPETLATRGRFPLDPLDTQNVSGSLDYQLPNRTGTNSNQTVFVNRFGTGYDVQSLGYLDPAHEELSVYNALPYRNLGIINYGLSGSASADPSLRNALHVVDQIDKDRGLNQRVSLHCGPFGSDAAYGSVPALTYVTTPSYQKVNRNRRRRIESGSVATGYFTGSRYDNGFVQHPIPQSDAQYMWVSSSLSSSNKFFAYQMATGAVPPTIPTITDADKTVAYEGVPINFAGYAFDRDSHREVNLSDHILESPTFVKNQLALHLTGANSASAEIAQYYYYAGGPGIWNPKIGGQGPNARAMTISFWANVDRAGSPSSYLDYDRIFEWQQAGNAGSRRRIYIDRRTATRFELKWAIDSVSGSAYDGKAWASKDENGDNLAYNKWYHFVCTFGGGSGNGTATESNNLIKMYVNGTYAGGTGAWPSASGSSPNSGGGTYKTSGDTTGASFKDAYGLDGRLLIGNGAPDGGTWPPTGEDWRPYNGYIDEAMIWDTDLDLTEVTELYNRRGLNLFNYSPAKRGNLVTWWRMGSTSGDTISKIKDVQEFAPMVYRGDTHATSSLTITSNYPSYSKNTSITFNETNLNLNGPYQYPSWKQIRTGEHKVARKLREKNKISMVLPTPNVPLIVDGVELGRIPALQPTRFVDYVEAPLSSRYRAIQFITEDNSESPDIANNNKIHVSYGNNLDFWSNEGLNARTDVAGRKDPREGQPYTAIQQYIKNNSFDFLTVYAERIYPAEKNVYQTRVRTRDNYSISNIWNSNRRLRTVSASNSQGFFDTAPRVGGVTWQDYAIDPSPWPLDSAYMMTKTTLPNGIIIDDLQAPYPTTGSGGGELQNTYCRFGISGSKTIHTTPSYVMPFRGGNRDIYPSVDGQEYVLQGFQPWLATKQSGLDPYQPYADFCKNIRLLGKDHTIVPEFRISELLPAYLGSENSNFLAKVDNMFRIEGSTLSSSAQQNFFKVYSNTDFMKHWKIVDEDLFGETNAQGVKIDRKKLQLECSALMQFLPYKGFYPAERTLELAALFSQSMGDIRSHNRSTWPDGSDRSTDGDNSVLSRMLYEPLFAPGILYNSIKSGIGVSHFVMCNTSSTPTKYPTYYKNTYKSDGSTTYRDYAFRDSYNYAKIGRGSDTWLSGLNLVGSGNVGALYGTANTTNGYYFQRVPFDAIRFPEQYLSRRVLKSPKIYDTGILSSSLAHAMGGGSLWGNVGQNYVSYEGTPKSDLYTLAIDNFLCETVDFFQTPLKSFVSREQSSFRDDVISGTYYSMQVRLNRPEAESTSDAPLHNRIYPGNDGFGMYSRGSSFGAPLWVTGTAAIAGADRSSITFSHVTPPYYNGASTANLIFKAPYDGRPTLADIFSNTIVDFSRSVDYSLSGSLIYDNKPARLSTHMQLSESISLFDKILVIPEGTTDQKDRWLIQTKFETPVLNFWNVSASVLPTGSNGPIDVTGSGPYVIRGMWHQKGNKLADTEGVLFNIEDTPPVLSSSYYQGKINVKPLKDIVGFQTTTDKKVGAFRENKIIKEAIIAVPFVTRENRREFFSLTQQDERTQAQRTLLQKYLFPPTFDYVANDDVSPVAFYAFEFEYELTQDDLINIWQNLPPTITNNFEKRTSKIEISGDILDRILAQGSGAENKLQWMIFKVKQRAKKDYNIFKKEGLTEQQQIIDPAISSPYSFNWPYDYFSLVELVKIDESVEYATENLVASENNN